RERGIDLAQLQRVLTAANLGMPAGSVFDVEQGRGMLAIETGELLRSAADLGSLVVGVHQGRPVYLSEAARIEAGAAQPRHYVWFSPGAGAVVGDPAVVDAEAGAVFPAVTLTVTKKPG